MKFKLVTLGGVKFDEDVSEVILPTLDGYIGVLTNHMPLVSVATTGIISVRKNSNDPDDFMEHFASNGGVIEVSNNVLSVLVDEADHADDISEQEAQAALERAKKLKSEAKDEISLEKAQSLIDRSAVRIQVAGLKRRKQRR
ncbi:ATP synthase F1 subunit epsilon [Candidatus Saccharibacteria bacterium]|nr:ATP synthase F1 subunit epsilon [Candidatus Saccharibacteria bacterium]